MALRHSTQAVTDTRARDAWGLTVSSTGSTATPFGFVGRQDYRTDEDRRRLLLPQSPAVRFRTPRQLGASLSRPMNMSRQG